MIELVEDTAHWQNVLPPLSPDHEEVAVYKSFIGTRRPVCLLGLTDSLVPLCDVAMDLARRELAIPTIQGNWNDLTGHYGAVIGDGVLNLEGFQLVDKIARVTSRFIARVFTKKLPGMKYATFFPTEFRNCTVIPTQDNIVIVVYDLN